MILLTKDCLVCIVKFMFSIPEFWQSNSHFIEHINYIIFDSNKWKNPKKKVMDTNDFMVAAKSKVKEKESLRLSWDRGKMKLR